MKITAPQLRAARALLGWSQDDLADNSGVSKPTIGRLEMGRVAIGGYAGTHEKLVRALAAAGVEFTNGSQPGVRLKAVAGGGMPAEDLNASNDE
jgi:transcriptional regulator with XRE-family HTH domain